MFSNVDGEPITEGSLTLIALESILLKPCQWYKTVSQATNCLNLLNESVVVIGGANILSRSIMRARKLISYLPSRQGSDMSELFQNPSKGISATRDQNVKRNLWRSRAIAVIGMSCRFADANSLQDFWKIVREARSLATEVPSCRFDAMRQPRTPKCQNGNYYGNFLSDVTEFDHSFFRMSPREAQSTDPQQRLVLQLTYEALQASAYFCPTSKRREENVGAYFGVTSDDYRDNIFSHPATPYSTTGSLRAFIGGRLSHFFGWDGPAITFDTACSSSAVAIHSACQAILADECRLAVAGGVNTITSPSFWQNLAAGKFVSPTGPCRPFDAAADGYCRGEGGGVLVLKALEAAESDGDLIWGILEASSVNQNQDSRSITEPSGRSQQKLFRNLLTKASRLPDDITYVESHGTGTPIGDPIECSSIRNVFGRTELANGTGHLGIGSVKANIGHTESASGVAAIIKVLLMMRHKQIPAQSNFNILNPNIPPLEPDGIIIHKETISWNAATRIACVNNYGAAGSKAAFIVSESLDHRIPKNNPAPYHEVHSSLVWPILLCARTPQNLQSYRQSLHRSLQSWQPDYQLSSLAFHITRQQNHAHIYRHVFKPKSVDNFLTEIQDEAVVQPSSSGGQASRPVVLVFGGQRDSCASLHSDVLSHCKLLRHHLNQVQNLCSKFHLPDIFPSISDSRSKRDLVQLHCVLFAIQYACARSWIDSGLQVDIVVGHSFGQLTALCIAGSLSLEEALRLVAERATLITRYCRDRRGSMLAVELVGSDQPTINHLLHTAATNDVDLACINGPSSFVFSGGDPQIAGFTAEVKETGICRSLKQLGNTYAYHSRLMDQIIPELRRLVASMNLKMPAIEIELTSGEESHRVDVETVVSHSRNVVHFHEAIKRIYARLESPIWVEAGSDSTVVSMVRKCLQEENDSLYIPIEISASKSEAFENLVHATCRLWNALVPVMFWCYDAMQNNEYSWVDVPPYSFSKHQHWLNFKESYASTSDPAQLEHDNVGSIPLVSPVRSTELSSNRSMFSINSKHETFTELVDGHKILGKPIAPASLYFEVALQCLRSMTPALEKKTGTVSLDGLQIFRALHLECEASIHCTITAPEGSDSIWQFDIGEVSNPETALSATGSIEVHSDTTFQASESEQDIFFKEFETRMSDPRAEMLRGHIIYRQFSELVSYESRFHGMTAIAYDGNDIFCRIARKESSICVISDAYALDYFVQPVGFALNFLGDRNNEEAFLCTSQSHISLDAQFFEQKRITQFWVHATPQGSMSARSRIYNILIFDVDNRKVFGRLTGIHFQKMSMSHLSHLLHNTSTQTERKKTEEDGGDRNGADSLARVRQASKEYEPKDELSTNGGFDPMIMAKELLGKVIGIKAADILDDSELMELGVDSLISTELFSGIREICASEIESIRLFDVSTVSSLAALIEKNFTHGKRSNTPAGDNVRVDDLQEPSLRKTCPSEARADLLKPIVDGHNFGSVSFNTCTMLAFSELKDKFADFAKHTGFEGFYDTVYSLQQQLICQYILNALDSLGCDLSQLKIDSLVEVRNFDAEHSHLVLQLLYFLRDESLLRVEVDGKFVRTAKPIPRQDTRAIIDLLYNSGRHYHMELDLISRIGPALCSCLNGNQSSVELLFGDHCNRNLVERVYQDSPMHSTASLFLQQLFHSVAENLPKSEKRDTVEILEIGGGTGATTAWIVQSLADSSLSWRYTFSDISSSFITRARRKLAGEERLSFEVLDICQGISSDKDSRFDVIISANCIHATPDLVSSLTNVRRMLKPDGVLILVEFTRNLAWFDVVFGLLEGWWNAIDGRTHPLVDEIRWKRVLQTAGFQWIEWSDGDCAEAKLLKVIAASPASTTWNRPRKQTFIYHTVEDLDLKAEIYFPHTPDPPGQKRPIG